MLRLTTTTTPPPYRFASSIEPHPVCGLVPLEEGTVQDSAEYAKEVTKKIAQPKRDIYTKNFIYNKKGVLLRSD